VVRTCYFIGVCCNGRDYLANPSLCYAWISLYLHEDHHQKGPGFWEKNDAFFVIFAIPSWLCIMLGSMNQNYWVVSIGAGIAMYGFAYFLVHEIIIHQRIKLFTRSNNRYIRAIRWAHKMHHKHLNKEDGESFGMLIVAKKYWDKIRRDEKLKAV